MFSILFFFGISTNRTLTKRRIQKSKSLCFNIQKMTKEKMTEGLNDAVQNSSFETKSRFAILIILVLLFISWTVLWWEILSSFFVVYNWYFSLLETVIDFDFDAIFDIAVYVTAFFVVVLIGLVVTTLLVSLFTCLRPIRHEYGQLDSKRDSGSEVQKNFKRKILLPNPDYLIWINAFLLSPYLWLLCENGR